MRWFKIILLIIVLLATAYSASMYFVDDSKEMTLEKEIPYPLEKVYPQFSNLQNFTDWNVYFSGQKDLEVSYFSPYEGQGSSLTFKNKKNNEQKGDLFIRYANPYKTLRYQLFIEENEAPYLIDIKFKAKDQTHTTVIWKIHTPKQSFFKRSYYLFIENFTEDNINQSMANLTKDLSRKVEKNQVLDHIKLDTILVEKSEAQIILGVSVNASNKKDALLKNIIMNHNKVKNFVQMDLGKKEDEIGFPMMISVPSELKNKEVSYFYGFPVAQKMGVKDNSFSFRTIQESDRLVIYYKGSFEGRLRPIQLLLQKAKKDTLRNGDIIESFLHDPQEHKECFMKIALPVFR